MNAILRPIHPQHCANIIVGLKTNEVRTKIPKCEVPYKVYIYCTLKGSNDLVSHIGLDRYWKEKWHLKKGMVIGEYICDKTVCYGWNYYNHGHYDVPDEELATTCLDMLDLIDYGGGGPLWFEHISNLVVYDEPVPISDFFTLCGWQKCDGCEYESWDYAPCSSEKERICTVSGRKPIRKPPQSYCFVQDRGEFYARA